MMRVVMFGSPGSGKSTFARALSGLTGLPHVERDTLGALGSPAYRHAVRRMASSERWIFDGATIQPDSDVYSRADTVIVLAYPRWVVMQRVLRRTARQAARRLVRSHQASERPPWLGPNHALTRAWSTYRARCREADALAEQPELAGAAIVRLSSPREARAWLASTARSAS
jgi:hypothetical protein